MDMLISANDLKVKGVTLIDSVVEENQGAIITVRGVEKYVVCPWHPSRKHIATFLYRLFIYS